MKKYKKWLIAGAILVPVVALVVFLSVKENPVIEPPTAQVRVMVVESSIHQEHAKYIGIIQPLELHQATFANIGTIEAVYVQEGQSVEKGDLLATLDSESARIALRNAQESLSAARHQRDEAAALMRAEEAAYLDAKANYEQLLLDAQADMLAAQQEVEASEAHYQQMIDEHGPESEEAAEAYGEFLAAQAEYELAQANYERLKQNGEPVEVQIAQARYQAARSAYNAADVQYNIALNNLQQAQGNMEQTRLLAAMDGNVIKVLAGPGDLATPLAPVVVVASHDVVAEIGISQRDFDSIKAGMAATVTVGAREYQGEVKSIALLPDTVSRTYQAKITVEDGAGLNLGETAAVQILTGPREGIWLPLLTIMNDGEDFVFVVVNGRISRRVISLGALDNDKVLVQGLEVGDQVVVEGGRLLRPGIEVEIMEVVNEDE